MKLLKKNILAVLIICIVLPIMIYAVDQSAENIVSQRNM